MNISVWRGALRYEWRMQVRRTSLWVTFGGFAIGALPFKGGLPDLLARHTTATPLTLLCQWSVLVNFLCLIPVAIFMTDRSVRDQRTRMTDLLATTAGSPGARLIGKYLGALSAALVPVGLYYALGVAALCLHAPVATVIPLAVLTWMTLIVPGALFVAAFSLALPLIIWGPLYQALFIGYWLWGNAFPPYPHFPIPTLSGTVLTPVGSAISDGLFGVPAFGLYHLPLLQGVVSLVLLPTLAVLVVLAQWCLQRWHQVQA